MSERWKPKHGELYYYISTTGVVTPEKFNECDAGKTARCFCGNCFRTVAEAEAAAEKVKKLLLSLHYNGTSTANSETLKDTFTEHLKKFAEQQIDKTLQKARERRLSEQYHNGPEEENTLPEWCKPGEWVYCDSDGYYYTVKRVDVKDDVIRISDKAMEYPYTANEIKTFFSPARLRSWNFEEAPFAVKCRHSITAIEYQVAKLNSAGNGYAVKDCCCDVTLQGMANYYEQMDGSPCGVLEHLENGEWVE